MSEQINFTKKTIDALPIPETGKRDTYHDTKTPGLQLRVTSTGAKTFSVYRRTKGGSPERVTLGRYPEMTIEQARKSSAEINLHINAGKNPADRLREAKREMTLNDLFQEYMERRAAFNRRPDKPQATYRLYLSDWDKRKLSTIKHEEVDRLHKKIGRNIGQVTANIVLKLLHVMFNKAINEWRIWKGENPAHGIAKFPEQSRDRFIQSDELPRFFQAVAAEENEIIRDYVLMSLLTGARRSNVLAMRWQDISFDRHEWRIEETKNGIPQTVALSPEAIEILQNRKPSNDAVFVFPGSGKAGHLMEPKKAGKESSSVPESTIYAFTICAGRWEAGKLKLARH